MATSVIVYYYFDPGDKISLSGFDTFFTFWDTVVNLIDNPSIMDLSLDWYHTPLTCYREIEDWAPAPTTDDTDWSDLSSIREGNPFTFCCNNFISESDNTIVASGTFASGWMLLTNLNTCSVEGDPIDLSSTAATVQALYVTCDVYFGELIGTDITSCYLALQYKNSADAWITEPTYTPDQVIKPHIELLLLFLGTEIPTNDIVKGFRPVVAVAGATSAATRLNVEAAYLSVLPLYAPVT